MTHVTASTGRIFLRIFLLMVAAVGGIMLLGAYPTHRMAGGDGIRAMIGAGIIGLIAGSVGLYPVSAAVARNSSSLMIRILAGTMIRFAVALFLAVPAAVSGLLEVVPLLIWLMIVYLLVLGVETAMVVRYIGDSKT